MADDLVAADFVGHAPGGVDFHGPEGVKEVAGFYHAAFSDIRWTIEDRIAAGDRIVLRTRAETVYLGGWHGIPSTRQPVVETGIVIFRIAEGLIQELWFEASDLDVAYQLGAFPPGSASTGDHHE